MSKYYNTEINTETQTMLKRAENFKQYLRDHNYKFEVSGSFNCLHFEILMNEHEVPMINTVLENIINFDSIKNTSKGS